MPELNYNRTIKQVIIDVAAASTATLVAAPGADLRIYVVYIQVGMGGAAGTVTFGEGAGPTAITGQIPLALNGGFTSGGGRDPILFTPTANSALAITTAGASATADGWLHYFVAA